MAIQFPGIRPLSFEESNPGLAGAKYGMNLIGQNQDILSRILEQQKAQKMMPFIQPQAQAQANLKKSLLENQFYAPNMQSEIEQRQALTNRAKTMTPLEAQELQLKNQFYPQLTQADINNKNALAEWRKIGGFGSGSGAGQHEILGLQRQIMLDHPDWDMNKANQAASAYLSGSDKLSDGTELPELSGIGRTFIAQIQKRNSTAAIQNQAANMNVLASDINDIDISPLKNFQQLPGRLNYLQYKAQMTSGGDVPQEFRDYEAFKDVTANFAMDALRKGFGTSVVPGYVYATLGKAANPASVWWHDPKLVDQEWNKTKEWINNNAKRMTKLGTQGLSANISKKMEQTNPDKMSNNMDLSHLSDEELKKIAGE